MVAHIAIEAGRYRGAVDAWDVVNEPFADHGDGGGRSGTRRWNLAMSPSR
jgi:GH35 family endo-1,4-beta-xylanase